MENYNDSQHCVPSATLLLTIIPLFMEIFLTTNKRAMVALDTMALDRSPQSSNVIYHSNNNKKNNTKQHGLKESGHLMNISTKPFGN